MTSGLTTFIPAGGLGSRLRPHTFETPKPLLLMGSSTRRIIDGPLDVSAGVSERTWVSTDYLASQVEEYLDSKPGVTTLRDGGTVGSGGSLLEHYAKFSDLESDGDLLILPSDHIYDGSFDMKQYLQEHRESGADITLMTVPQKPYGEYLRVNGNKAIAVETRPAAQTVSTTGTFIFRNSFILDILHRMKRSDKTELNIYKDLVCPYIGRTLVTSYFIDDHVGYWEDTGTPERFLSSNMRLSGDKNVVSNDAIIGTNVRLRRCVILGGAVVSGEIQIENAIISSSSNGTTLITGVCPPLH